MYRPHAILKHHQSLRNGRSEVRTGRVYIERSSLRDNYEVHVFHRDRSEQHLVTHNQGTDKANAILESQFYRTYVGHEGFRAVRKRRFFRVDFFQLKLKLNVLRDAKMR